MEDVKEALINEVQKYPALWDTREKDYKDADQKNQIWQQIQKDLNVQSGINLKDTWGVLLRGHTNALRRQKECKSGSEASTSKQWKFLQQMSFLLPIKGLRWSKGNLDDDEGAGESADHFENDSFTKNDSATEPSDVDEPQMTSTSKAISSRTEKGARKEANKKRLKRKSCDSEDAILSFLKANKKNPRMAFFESIREQIEDLDVDEFNEFQVNTLNNLRYLKTRRQGLQAMSYPGQQQQQQQPDMSSSTYYNL